MSVLPLETPKTPTIDTLARPRLGFLGVGWIGRSRMEALIEADAAEVAAVADPCSEMLEAACQMAPGAIAAPTFEELLTLDLDGIVIATPSAQHAAQSIRALEAGFAVFCQKPLGRTRDEVAAVVAAAEKADRLLGVDFSYRHTTAMREVRRAIRRGELGEVFAADLTFHNAYGPDKPWFFDKSLSGGGCVMDLGVHLVDLALWALDFPEVEHADGQLLCKGQRIANDGQEVEDFASATVTLKTGAVIRFTCSWRLNAGHDAQISASFYGTRGGASFHNVNGSFYDFNASMLRGTTSEPLATPPDAWGGRAALAWSRKLQEDAGFDPAARDIIKVAKVLDDIYDR